MTFFGGPFFLEKLFEWFINIVILVGQIPSRASGSYGNGSQKTVGYLRNPSRIQGFQRVFTDGLKAAERGQ